ncbi:MAG: helix-turn-helix domain-containing protein [Nanoarchaeota archaeon]|nr:helix-turn-helix domain-containing protein [Nanoarchaeota archaeon]
MINETLSKLGMNAYEISIYVSLVEYGRMNARDVSKQSKVPITAVYPNLKSLIEKGFIQKIDREVSLYSANDITRSVSAYADKRNHEMNKLSSEAVSLLTAIKSKKQIAKESDVVEVSFGGAASTQLIMKMAGDTKKSYYMLGWRFSTTKNMFNILNKLKELVKDKKDVRIIVTQRGKAYEDLIEHYVNSGIKIRYYRTSDFSIAVRDAEECKLGVKNPELPERVNVHIKNPGLSSSMQDYFLSVWNKSKKEIYF